MHLKNEIDIKISFVNFVSQYSFSPPSLVCFIKQVKLYLI